MLKPALTRPLAHFSVGRSYERWQDTGLRRQIAQLLTRSNGKGFRTSTEPCSRLGYVVAYLTAFPDVVLQAILASQRGGELTELHSQLVWLLYVHRLRVQLMPDVIRLYALVPYLRRLLQEHHMLLRKRC